MNFRLNILTLWLIAVIILSGCSPVLSVDTQPSAMAIQFTASPFPMAINLPATLTSLPSPKTSTSPPLVTMVPIQSAQDSATFVGENYPDNSVLAPGQTFVKTWEIKNTSSLTWTTAYQLVLSASPG